jgi:hypothetical protein
MDPGRQRYSRMAQMVGNGISYGSDVGNGTLVWLRCQLLFPVDIVRRFKMFTTLILISEVGLPQVRFVGIDSRSFSR